MEFGKEDVPPTGAKQLTDMAARHAKAKDKLYKLAAGGQLVMQCALHFAPRAFIRPGELHKAEWEAFDLAAKQWNIPETKMKMDVARVVPPTFPAFEQRADWESNPQRDGDWT